MQYLEFRILVCLHAVHALYSCLVAVAVSPEHFIKNPMLQQPINSSPACWNNFTPWNILTESQLVYVFKGEFHFPDKDVVFMCLQPGSWLGIVLQRDFNRIHCCPIVSL